MIPRHLIVLGPGHNWGLRRCRSFIKGGPQINPEVSMTRPATLGKLPRTVVAEGMEGERRGTPNLNRLLIQPPRTLLRRRWRTTLHLPSSLAALGREVRNEVKQPRVRWQHLTRTLIHLNLTRREWRTTLHSPSSLVILARIIRNEVK